MFFRRRIETNRFQKYVCNKSSLLSGGFDTCTCVLAQVYAFGYSTTEFLQISMDSSIVMRGGRKSFDGEMLAHGSWNLAFAK